jgi:hypothetical protein
MITTLFRGQTSFEQALTIGSPVTVCWSAGSFGHFEGKGIICKINSKSFRIELTETVVTKYGSYPKGYEVTVPKLNSYSQSSRWAVYNRVMPFDKTPYSQS